LGKTDDANDIPSAELLEDRVQQARSLVGEVRGLWQQWLNECDALFPQLQDHTLRASWKTQIRAQLQNILPELDDVCIALLSMPLFETTVDDSFRTHGEPDTVVTTSVLGIKDGRSTMCYDKSVMRGTTVAAQEALEEFGRAIEKHTNEIALTRGDLLIIDNSNTVHGRKPFQASYDGTDRWVQRLLVRSYTSPVSPDLEMCPLTGYPVITKYK
jgi:hypothetical protein